jgi:CheY-like chemotaxis protein
MTPLIKTAKIRAEEEMNELTRLGILAEVPCETEIRVGPAIDEIVGESSAPGIDLVVTSTHGYTGFKRAVIGSVSRTRCPLRGMPCPYRSKPKRFLKMKENTILLLDTDGDSEAIVSEAATRTGRDVVVAKTAREAFRILGDQMQRLELVVVDVDPGAHGLALLEAISSCAERPPIVVITALEETYMEPISLKHGAAACLGKPIAVQRLGSSLNDASKRSLTCDRWGCLIPSTANKELNVETCFRGIAAKLNPTVSSHGCRSCRP